jgi:putative tricarboxylic transport membrane protein
VLVFAGALWVSGSFSEEARLMPRLVATCGLVASLLLVWQEVRVRRSRPERPAAEAPDEPLGTGGSTMVATRVEPVADQHALARAHDLRIAARAFAAMAVFLGLAMVGGYLAATLVFTPAFLLYASRVRPRTAIVYTLVLGALLLALPTLLPVDLPMGLLQ